jgi:hypothetical protein
MIARNADGSPWGGHVSPAIKDAPLFGGSDIAEKMPDRLAGPSVGVRRVIPATKPLPKGADKLADSVSLSSHKACD